MVLVLGLSEEQWYKIVCVILIRNEIKMQTIGCDSDTIC